MDEKMSKGNGINGREDFAMFKRVQATIQKYNMISSGDRILVGVSGGPDSVVLVHILKLLSEEMKLQVFVAHLNHCFRGLESDKDAIFVEKLAQKLQLTAVIESRDTPGYTLLNKVSAQTGARELRYRFFEEKVKQLGCNKLATGHNANDQAETLLINFLRGSGPRGLGGIPPVRDGWVIRPLIEISRNQIEAYCTEHFLETRIDQSNLKNVYTRNKLRLELLPHLQKEYNANLVETLVRTGEIFREEELYLEEVTRNYWENVRLYQEAHLIRISLMRFLDMPAAFQRRVIRYAWVSLSGTTHNLQFNHLENMLNIVRSGQTGSKIDLPMGISLIKNYEDFILTNETSNDEPRALSYELAVPGVSMIFETGDAILAEIIEITGGNIINTDPDEIIIDLNIVGLPLFIRSRKDGDWFKPTGMEGSKKIKKFLIDQKVLKRERDLIPILVSGDEQIVWVVGLRADRRWQIASGTKTALKLKLMRNILKQN